MKLIDPDDDTPLTHKRDTKRAWSAALDNAVWEIHEYARENRHSLDSEAHCRVILHAVGVGNEFHVRDLHRFVEDKTNGAVAPASADRILRDLRASGQVRYSVVNRSQSLYRVEEIR